MGKGKVPRLVDERLLTALSNPTRAAALVLCSERPTSPKEAARQMKRPLSGVSYHFDQLVELGCIEEVETRKRRGAREHFYRAIVKSFFDNEAWEAVPPEERLGVTVGILRMISADIHEAINQQTSERADTHISRVPMTVDQTGWDEVVTLLEETLDQLLAIRARVNARRDGATGPLIHTSVSILHVELPTAAGP